MAYSFEDDVALGPRRSSSEAPYEQSRSKAALRALLIGLAASSKVRPGAGPLASFGTGALYGHEQKTAAEKAATDYAMKQMQAQQAEEDRTIRNRYIEAQMKNLEKPPAPPKPEGLVQIAGPSGPIYVRESDAVGKPAYKEPKDPKDPKAEPLVAIIGPDGKPKLVRQSQAEGKTPAGGAGAEKPPDSTQRAKAGVLRAASAAETSLRTQEDALGKMNIFEQVRLSAAPNYWQTPTARKYRQAADWWIENILRDASGAAINKDEYPKYRNIYFAVPGDDEGTKEQKRASRQVMLEKYRELAGGAAENVPQVNGISNFDPEAARKKYGY